MTEKEMLDITVETTKEVAKEAYGDVGKPVAKPTGELLGLIPRAIKAALAPLEKWILQREYNVAETKKLLEEKLQAVPLDLIETPEPHIAIPAMQYISYCMDNEELRNMYANLLANSMNKVVKNGVHPGFVEIIKQLSPDEAKILKHMNITQNNLPTISLQYKKKDGGGIYIMKNFSNIGELSGCENPYEVNKYFDNMVRLGLLENAGGLASLTNKTLYEPLKNHTQIVSRATEQNAKAKGYDKYTFEESFVCLTDFGKSFCSICLGTPKIIILKAEPQ